MQEQSKEEEEILTDLTKMDKVFKDESKKAAQDLKKAEKLLKDLEKS